MNVTINNLRPS